MKKIKGLEVSKDGLKYSLNLSEFEKKETIE